MIENLVTGYDRADDSPASDSRRAALPRLAVRTWFIDGVDPAAPQPFTQGLPNTPLEFLGQLPPTGFDCWVRGHSGLVGFGRVVRLRTSGTERFADLSAAWAGLVEAAVIDDQVSMPGSGLVGFSTVAFSPASDADSLVDVPRYVLGRKDGRAWLTSIDVIDTGEAEGAGNAEGEVDFRLEPRPFTRPEVDGVEPGATSAEDYRAIVAEASARMRARPADLHKVVLARDEVVHTKDPIDIRVVLGLLNQEYPSCWTFNVGDLIGATPELLIGLEDGRVTSRVLAGTYRVQEDPAAELDAAREQLGAAKDSAEHEYAIRSLEESLSKVTSSLHVDTHPHLLQLANVVHLASDAHGTLAEPGSGRPLTALDVAAAVHPTAAVGGAPTGTALTLMHELEGADRGRYAGPVGWLDSHGNGQFGIALRCGQLETPTSMRIWAGAGIMPDSDPASELAETEAKFAPMKRALGVPRG